jgi:hypothetical protein
MIKIFYMVILMFFNIQNKQMSTVGLAKPAILSHLGHKWIIFLPDLHPSIAQVTPNPKHIRGWRLTAINV